MCLLTLGQSEAHACCTAVIQAAGMGMQLPTLLTLQGSLYLISSFVSCDNLSLISIVGYLFHYLTEP